ncbi:MAG: phospholipase A [Burkholderiales bacterium]|nr:phospholipase A [Burkholderiales bacterium]
MAAAAACLCAARIALGGELLLPPTEDVAAGSIVRMDLLVTNDGGQPLRYAVRDVLRVRLIANDQAFQVDLQRDPDSASEAGADTGEIEIAPQAFRRIAYRVRLPLDVHGIIMARGQDGDARAVMFKVLPADQVAQPDAQAGAASASPAATASTSPLLTRESAFAAALSAYEPVYFSAGSHGGANAKFQLSLKYRLFNENAGLARRIPALAHLYLGYTQSSLWDLESRSNPFRDTSYQPRLFYADNDVWHGETQPVRLSAEFGLGHESNGRGGDESRSINIAYVRPGLTLGRTGKWQVTFAPKIYTYLDKEDNPDIAEYRGYVDYSATIGKADRWQLTGLLREGTGEGWSVQMDLSYPLRSVAIGNLNGYLHFQYFGGWGESMLDYDRRLPAQYRIGLMFVR